MQVKERTGLPSDHHIGTTAKQFSPAQVKKIVPFRNGKTGDQPGLSFMSGLSGGMRRCQSQGTEPVQNAGPDLMLDPFCDHVEQVRQEDIATSFRVFQDRLGICWRCFMPMICDHAVIIAGRIHSCRVRVHAINELAAGGS